MPHHPYDLPTEVGHEDDTAQVPRKMQISAAEETVSARIGAVLFKNRGWLPLLFLGVPLLARGNTEPSRWVIGLALIAIGEFFRLSGVAAAGTTTRRRSRDVQHLVTHGIFSWSRNPLYNGNFLVWIGFVVISGVMWFLPVAVLVFAAEYSLIVRFEEGVLESTFGRLYLDYKNTVPRWLPRRPVDPPVGELDWRDAWKSEVSTFIQYGVLIAAFFLKEHVFHWQN